MWYYGRFASSTVSRRTNQRQSNQRVPLENTKSFGEWDQSAGNSISRVIKGSPGSLNETLARCTCSSLLNCALLGAAETVNQGDSDESERGLEK